MTHDRAFKRLDFIDVVDPVSWSHYAFVLSVALEMIAIISAQSVPTWKEWPPFSRQIPYSHVVMEPSVLEDSPANPRARKRATRAEALDLKRFCYSKVSEPAIRNRNFPMPELWLRNHCNHKSRQPCRIHVHMRRKGLGETTDVRSSWNQGILITVITNPRSHAASCSMDAYARKAISKSKANLGYHLQYGW